MGAPSPLPACHPQPEPCAHTAYLHTTCCSTSTAQCEGEDEGKGVLHWGCWNQGVSPVMLCSQPHAPPQGASRSTTGTNFWQWQCHASTLQECHEHEQLQDGGLRGCVPKPLGCPTAPLRQGITYGTPEPPPGWALPGLVATRVR